MPLQRWGGFEIAHRIALPDIAKAHELMEQRSDSQDYPPTPPPIRDPDWLR